MLIAIIQIVRYNAFSLKCDLVFYNLSNKALYREPIVASLDGNTVELSVEQMQFAENTMRYQTTLTFLNGKIGKLISAIRGE